MSTQKENNSQVNNDLDEVLYRSERFYEKHLKKIIIGVVAVVLVVLLFFAYKFFISEPKEQKAYETLYMAEENFINGQDSLTVYGNGKANMGTKEVSAKYSGTDAANISYAYSGISLYDMGKYQEALDMLKKFKTSEKYVSPSIIRLMGDCYVQLGKNSEAVEAYKEAAKKSDNPAITPSCLIKQGHVLESMGKYDDAISCYNEVKTKYYQSPESMTVDADIMRCKSKQQK